MRIANSSIARPTVLNRPAHGFTLLELMLVISIVVLVAGMLMSALNRTKNNALRVGCMDNMRQLQLAWGMYIEDNEDRMPLNQAGPVAFNSKLGPRSSTNSWVAGNPREDKNTDGLKRGTLFSYVRTTDIYKCPTDSSKVSGQPGIDRNRSYAMSAYLGGDNGENDTRVKIKLSELAEPGPSQTFVFIEEHENSLWGAGFTVLTPAQEVLFSKAGISGSTPSDHHNRGCYLTFADSHIEFWRWYTPKSVASTVHVTSSAREKADSQRLQNAVPQP